MRAKQIDSNVIRLTDLPCRNSDLDSFDIKITSFCLQKYLHKYIIPAIINAINDQNILDGVEKKMAHGCYDVYCEQCDGSRMD